MTAPSIGIPWARIAITLAAVATLLAASALVPIPLLNPQVEPLFRAVAWHWTSGGIFALGFTPLLGAAILIELVVRLVPRLRCHLESETPRLARYRTFILALAMILGAGMAHGIASSIASASSGVSPSTKAIWAGSLVTAQIFVVLFAAGISRFGLGNGLCVLFTVGIAGEFADLASTLRNGPSFTSMAASMITPVVVAACTVWILRSRTKIPSSPDVPPLRSPTSGMAPVALAFALPMIAGLFALVGYVDATVVFRFARGNALFALIAVPFVILTTPLVARMFPSASGEQSLLATHGRTWAFFVFLVVRPALLPTAIDPLMVVLTTAVVMDLGAEVSARRAHGDLAVVRRLPDVYRADVAALALQQAGIPVLLRNAFYLTTVRFVGLLLPIEVMVPRSSAERASTILSAQS